jgi:hypothetical protein
MSPKAALSVSGFSGQSLSDKTALSLEQVPNKVWLSREGKHTLLTPGLLCGKFPINDCIRSAFRAATQIAVTANSR